MTGTNGISSLQTLIGSLNVNETRQSPPAKASSPATQATIGQPDHASLSAAAGLAAQPAGDSDVRMDKVAALQQAISSGTYNVPASAVASKLVDTLMR